MYVKYACMHGFQIKVKKEQKYGIKLTWVIRWLLKVFGVLASRESLALNLSYFLAIFLFFK